MFIAFDMVTHSRVAYGVDLDATISAASFEVPAFEVLVVDDAHAGFIIRQYLCWNRARRLGYAPVFNSLACGGIIQ